MNLIPIESIWHRTITEGDFFNIERSSAAGPSGGGGQLFIDLPKEIRIALFDLLGREAPDASGNWPPASVVAQAIGAPALSGKLRFELNRRGDGRYRIMNQNRQQDATERHPAWTSENGFPEAPDNVRTKQDAAKFMQGGIHVYLVKCTTGDYFAGFTVGTAFPASWPQGFGLEDLYSSRTRGGLVKVAPLAQIVERILDAWTRQPNVLLYGPTGTGKTRAMNLVWRALEDGKRPDRLLLDPKDRANPFRTQTAGHLLPTPVARDWVTFHQNYGYEDFVMGLRPMPAEGGGITLRPRAGRLLQLGISVASSTDPAHSAVMMIDELNRGNTSRIFGEFITFMEYAYRDHDSQGGENQQKIPVPLASLSSEGGRSEPIDLSAGGSVELSVPWFFPRHVYTLASMNSVDRTVAPLDSALARRFERIEMRPDREVLESILGVRVSEAQAKTKSAATESEPLSARECALLLLVRLNFQLATTLGPDFEIGHAYMLPVGETETDDDGFRALATVWDQAIMPQLHERFLTRQEELLRILRVGEDVPDEYPFRAMSGLSGGWAGERPVLEPVSLERLAGRDLAAVQRAFRYLASYL